MTDEQIARLITRRERLTNRRDGLTDSKRVKRIDAQLATVPVGTRNDVDLLLGRDAQLPPREDYGLLDRAAEMKRIAEDAMRNQPPIEY